MIEGNKLGDFKKHFEKKYFDEFGFISEERDLLVEAVRVRSTFMKSKNDQKKTRLNLKRNVTPAKDSIRKLPSRKLFLKLKEI